MRIKGVLNSLKEEVNTMKLERLDMGEYVWNAEGLTYDIRIVVVNESHVPEAKKKVQQFIKDIKDNKVIVE